MEKIKVLIVEDDPMVADINRRFTEAVEGFVVVGIANNGSDALDMVSRLQPDLIILDIYMPQLDGVEVLGLLRKGEIPVDIILVTAANDSEVISKVMRFGVIDYIIKPFKFDRYRNTLEKYRTYRNKLIKKDNFSQGEVDKIFSVKMSNRNKVLPKSLHVQTLESITSLLAHKVSTQSADDIAAEMGISRVTARRYLEYLVNEGTLEMVLEYLPVGRPVHRFRMKQ